MHGHDGVASYSWLGGLDPIPDFNPPLQMASGVYVTFFGSFVFGTPGFPLSDVPLQQIAADAAIGRLYVGWQSTRWSSSVLQPVHALLHSHHAWLNRLKRSLSSSMSPVQMEAAHV
jgi:hypothetical protein